MNHEPETRHSPLWVHIAGHPVAAFFVLTYVYSWAFWASAALGVSGPVPEVLVFAPRPSKQSGHGETGSSWSPHVDTAMWIGVFVLLATTRGRLGPPEPEISDAQPRVSEPVGGR